MTGDEISNADQVAILAEVTEAVFERLKRRTVPMLVAGEGGSIGVQGAGVLLRVQDLRVLVTAGHVLEGDLGRMGIPRFPHERGSGLLSLSSADVRHGPREHDVAAVILDGELGTHLSEDWEFVLPENLLSGPPEHLDRFMVAGFPAVWAKEIGRDRLSAQFHIHPACRFEGEIDSRLVEVDPDVDLLLSHGKIYKNAWGQALEAPKLQGVSGSAVWAVQPPSEGEVRSLEGHVMKICGVQCSAMHGTFVRAKKWHVVAELLRDIDPSAAEAVAQALEHQ